ncbi:aminotransferase class V-fold PLP-dependent enzyme [Desulfosarcina ovata]|uniref:Aminotransferase n=1 Tax=Desulfosarcina ovata subsp. ovata TaxID=2752305 RepID=A0A5K8A7N4_9BACT|nr:aminotransferase class V-fold PLP-dependent enzyme [Desulfosarcina ovata]BBO88545.1 hypothetical protein DSCOOX_17250 [Desulfosarcina ovata subsp. ovata]
MLKFLKNLAWYPPAETKIPWSAILSTFNREPVDFKSVLCNYLNVKHCILAESARVLLYKLLLSLKEREGGNRDEVLIPGYTCYSVAASVAKAGLKIAVYDLDPSTLFADVDSLRRAISEKTLAVVAQHLFGILSPLDEIINSTQQHGAYLIEDAAQAFGKGNELRAPGTLGDFGLFSFGRGKPLPVGGGGALVSNSHQDILNITQIGSEEKGYKQAIVTAATQAISKPYLYWIPEMLPLGLGETVFDPDFNVEGLPRAMESMMAMSLPSLDRLNQHRRKISDIYSEMIDPKLQVLNSDQATSIIRFPVMLTNTMLDKKMKRYGIRQMYPHSIVDEISIKPHLRNKQGLTPGATEIAEKLFTLPTHIGIDERMAKDISILVQKTVRQDLQD